MHSDALERQRKRLIKLSEKFADKSWRCHAFIIIISLFAIFSYQIADIYHAMAGHQKKTESSPSWRPIVKRTVVNILFRKNIYNETKKEKN